jgi:alkylation response protein AidB-like acyl-CoA dehydrogenase
MNHSFATRKSTVPLPEREGLLALIEEIRVRRDEFAAQRHISKDIIARFQELGVYRALVAKQFGGEERSPAEFCQLIEKISEADGSAGWVASFGVSAIYLAALPEPTLRKIYADGPDVVFAGGLFPLQPARRTPDGFVLKGRWKFASGCTGASLLGIGITIEGEQAGGLPRIAVMPANGVRIDENWDVIGLEGTGSHDLLIENLIVPEEWTLIRGSKASVETAVNRYPVIALAAQVLTVVGLGVARSALDEFIEHAGGFRSITGAANLGDRPYVQSQVAKADILLRSARSLFYETTEKVWREAQVGEVSLATTNLLRLASTYSAQSAAEVTHLVFGLTGIAAIQTGHRFNRTLLDCAAVAQHYFMSEATWQNGGAVMLGLPAAPGFP